MSSELKEWCLRMLPSVDEVLRDGRVLHLLAGHPRQVVVRAVRKALAEERRAILDGVLPEGKVEDKTFFLDVITRKTLENVDRTVRHKLRPVINATGVVLHTNLGRAPFSEGAREAVNSVISGYSNLELDLDTGKRGSRYAPLEPLLVSLTGAEAALVVNNNAAAVLLALSTLARGREVIVSRGQLVEIGGSFRVPEVMAQSGARLVEVGTTNKTYPDDYRQAINQNTALLLHVHTSNYRIIGFTRETSVAELVELGRAFSLPVMSDLGSGFLVDLNRYGLPGEPTVQEVVGAGADVVTFSGDKLLGGPQAGIIVGKSRYIEAMKKNPLTRAIRIDKMTVAALEATLREYLDENHAIRTVPVLQMLTAGPEQLKEKALQLAGILSESVKEKASIYVEEDSSAVGGGAMPTAVLPTFVVAVCPVQMSAGDLQEALRRGEPAVIGRVREERLLLDVRTVSGGQFQMIAKALAKALDKTGEGAAV
ncbi:MAG: L-seryl-tRNA(Sec) selenium transferase [Pelotomaculum sp.]|nr:L-seryl-tRNA(Sec) selenium transferase [Pelotomaculum sp.]